MSAPKTETEEWKPRRDRAVQRANAAWTLLLSPEHAALLESLPMGWGEAIEQWGTCQILLTDAGVPPGLGAQAGGDLDTRVAKYAVPALIAIDRIAEAHRKNVDEHGGTSGDCNECGWSWPCPTYVWATSDRDSLACWNPSDDEEADRG